MNWGTVLAKTVLGLAILGVSVAYMTCDVPLDGMIDIREAVLSLTGLFAGLMVLAGAWLGVLWRLAVVLAKDVRVFLEVAGGRISDFLGKRRKAPGKRPRTCRKK